MDYQLNLKTNNDKFKEEKYDDLRKQITVKNADRIPCAGEEIVVNYQDSIYFKYKITEIKHILRLPYENKNKKAVKMGAKNIAAIVNAEFIIMDDSDDW